MGELKHFPAPKIILPALSSASLSTNAFTSSKAAFAKGLKELGLPGSIPEYSARRAFKFLAEKFKDKMPGVDVYYKEKPEQMPPIPYDYHGACFISAFTGGFPRGAYFLIPDVLKILEEEPNPLVRAAYLDLMHVHEFMHGFDYRRDGIGWFANGTTDRLLEGRAVFMEKSFFKAVWDGSSNRMDELNPLNNPMSVPDKVRQFLAYYHAMHDNAKATFDRFYYNYVVPGAFVDAVAAKYGKNALDIIEMFPPTRQGEIDNPEIYLNVIRDKI